jgi:hypothetical protein
MNLVKTVFSHRLAKQATTIVLYLVLARVVAVAASAWTARCLGPEKPGISGMIGAVMGGGNVCELFVGQGVY